MKSTKKQFENNARLRRLVEAYVLQRGGKYGDSSVVYELWLSTKLGSLRVTTVDDWIACRFEEPQRAADHLGYGRSNPYSGKWNHGCGQRLMAEELFEWWSKAVDRLLV